MYLDKAKWLNSAFAWYKTQQALLVLAPNYHLRSVLSLGQMKKSNNHPNHF